jgi:hypothetical protein
VAGDLARNPTAELAELLGAVTRDAGRLAGLHMKLLRSELRQELRAAGGAAASLGAGAGLVAAGGLCGVLMLVHGLHRATRLPLWGCYGLVGGALAGAGAGLIASGARRAARLDLVPRQTLAALQEDLAWLKDQAPADPA